MKSPSVHTFSLVETPKQQFLPFGENSIYSKGITIIGDKQHVDHYVGAARYSNCNHQIIKHSDVQQVFSERFCRKKSSKTNAFQKITTFY
jgi:hypothetical protein